MGVYQEDVQLCFKSHIMGGLCKLVELAGLPCLDINKLKLKSGKLWISYNIVIQTDKKILLFNSTQVIESLVHPDNAALILLFLPWPRFVESAMTIRHLFRLFFFLFFFENKLPHGQYTSDPHYFLQILDPL